MTADRFLDIACFECWTYWAAMFGPARRFDHKTCALRRRVVRKAWELA